MKINIKLQSALPDRIQFKPYGVTLDLSNLCVQVDVPDEEVVEVTISDAMEEVYVLTPRGVAIIASKIADAIDQIHIEYQEKKNRG